MRLHYLGPAGTFSESAAQAFGAPQAAAVTPCPSIAAVIDAVARGQGPGVVPYYNLIDGLVQESLDRILHAQLQIRGALHLPIQLALGGAQDAAPSAPVYSHAKALAQCSDYLDAQHPLRTRIAVSSTAEGVERAAAEAALAVAGLPSFASRGVPVLQGDVTNRYFGRENYTEFLYIDRADAAVADDAGPPNRCMLACAPQTDRPGLLADLLGLLAFFDINLARIHSRPAIAAAPTTLDPQLFYFEIAGTIPPDVLDICTRSLTRALAGDDDTAVLFQLGQYPLQTLTD